ncbi:MAG: hypothetical protein ABI967_01000 [bacterium]
MESRFFQWQQLTAACLLAMCFVSVGLAHSNAYAAQAKEAEVKAVDAIKAAPDRAAKLAAAEAFVKKYPKSTLRPEVVHYLATEIDQMTDATQKATLAEQLQKTFTEPKELELVQPLAVDAYLGAKRTDEAFSLGATVLSKQPENVGVLTMLTIAGAEEAKKQNGKYVVQSQQYGLKAVELIEANKKPVSMDDATWARRTAMLPELYQELGVLALVSSNSAEAKARLEKSIALKPDEPISYFFLGSIYNDDYQKMAEKYRTMPEGADKAATLVKATEMMDKVIEYWARSLGMSAGRAEYKQLHDQVLQDLTAYYQYRHKGSTEGMQAMIDKYKTPAKP